MKKKVAIIGTQGVPAHYGGFESLVENIIGEFQSPDVEYTVFCSSQTMDRSLPRYKGANLKYIDVYPHGARSILYDGLSILKALRNFDAMLILGVSGCTLLPILKHFSKARIIVNIDGHEYRRTKWGPLARRFLKWSESCAVKHADTVVTDNKGIQQYVKQTYGRNATLIAYGGNQALRDLSRDAQDLWLAKNGLTAGGYALSICRIEPENNCDLTLQACAELGVPLVFVGNWGHSRYSQELYERYQDHPDIHLLDSIYDLDILYTLRNNSLCYIHGHSAGGTNPSLAEAMFFNSPILCYDVVYNRETTFNKASYYSSVVALKKLLNKYLTRHGRKSGQNLHRSPLPALALRYYSWPVIAAHYESLY